MNTEGVRINADVFGWRARKTEDRDYFLVDYRFTATYEGHPVEVPGVMWCSIEAGVIVRRTDTWDSLTFLRQTDQA